MVNTGRFAKEVLAQKPPTANAQAHESVRVTHVIACYMDKWLRFDSMDLARKVVPPKEHHRIYADMDEMSRKLGVKRLMELGRKFGCKTTAELWAKLHMTAYDPAVRYEELHEAEVEQRRTRGTRPKRYIRKISYRINFDPNEEGCMNIYGRLPPQACALLDILYEAIEANGSNVFTEAQMRGIVELRRDELHTKQDPWRIFQYYRGKLITCGFLRFAKEKSDGK
jgi:hypothetical protein